MFCQKCGIENPNDARFCRSCGSQIIIPEPPIINEKSVTNLSKDRTQEYPNYMKAIGQSFLGLIITAIITFIICLIYAILTQ